MNKKKFKLDKSIVIIISLLVIYLIIMLVLFLPSYLRKMNDKLYIITNDYSIKYEKGNWKYFDSSSDYKKKFDIYVDNSYLGNYNAVFNNRFFLYNDDLEPVRYGGKLFGYNGTISLDYYYIEELEKTENDISVINRALESLGVYDINEINLFQKISIDIDNDQNNETVYCINNYYTYDGKDKFSIIFVDNDGKIDIIEKVITTEDMIYSATIYGIDSVMDVKQDKSYELIITKNYYSDPDSECVVIYNLTNKKVINNLCK